MLLNREFNKDSKNVIKTVNFSLQAVLQPILSLTVLSNSVFVSLNFYTAFLLDCTKFLSDFFMLLNREFNKHSKNVAKMVIFSLQVGFAANFAFDCTFKLYFCQFKL